MPTPRADTEHRVPVAIVGAGPVGLATALALSRHGVRSVVLERAPATSTHSKAPAIHARTREILAQWGVLDAFLEAGTLLPVVELHDHGRRPRARVDFRDLDDDVDRPGILFLEQAETERLLLDAVQASGLCEVRFGAEVVALEAARHDRHVSSHAADAAHGPNLLTIAHAAGRSTLEAEYVVGADGARSFVRSALGLPFDGLTYRVRPMLADVRVRDERDALPWPRLRNDRGGLTPAFRLREGLWRIIRLEAPHPERGEDVPDAEVQRRAAEVLGDGPPVEVVWAGRFRIHLRSAPRFRVGRVLLAGDAAHVHSPAAGLGMNAGIQDAFDLGWKLAHALRGGDVDALLDAYDVERRHASVERVSRYTDALTRVFLLTPAVVREAAYVALRGLLRVPRIRQRAVRRQSMVDLVYPPSSLTHSSDACAGERLPNPLVRAPDGAERRLHDLLPEGAALLDLSSTRLEPDLPGLRGLPVLRLPPDAVAAGGSALGRLAAAGPWVLVRPDRHVAWARPGLEDLERHVRRALGLGATAAIGSGPDPAADGSGASTRSGAPDRRARGLERLEPAT